jgi:hypothetical protein
MRFLSILLQIILNDKLDTHGPTSDGGFKGCTAKGVAVSGEVLLMATGIRCNSAFMKQDLADAVDEYGRIKVSTLSHCFVLLVLLGQWHGDRQLPAGTTQMLSDLGSGSVEWLMALGTCFGWQNIVRAVWSGTEAADCNGWPHDICRSKHNKHSIPDDAGPTQHCCLAVVMLLSWAATSVCCPA